MIARILDRVDTALEYGRWFLAGAIALATLRWAVLALRDRAGVDTWRSPASWGVDPDTGLRLRTGLTPAEVAAARDLERRTELVG